MFKRSLTEDEMKRIESKARSAEQVVIEFYDIALGDSDSSFDEQEMINPTDFCIPNEQWREIAGWLNQAFPVKGGFNGALMWMNSGPSGYEVQAVSTSISITDHENHGLDYNERGTYEWDIKVSGDTIELVEAIEFHPDSGGYVFCFDCQIQIHEFEIGEVTE